MKYYSEKLKKVFDTPQECEDAEFKAKEQENRDKILAERKAAELKEKKEKAAAERKAAAEKVETARKAMLDAQKAYRDEIESFCKAYGTYHTSWTGKSDIPTLFDLVERIWF